METNTIGEIKRANDITAGEVALNLVRHPYHVYTRQGDMVHAFASMKVAVSCLVLNYRVSWEIRDTFNNRTYNYMDALKMRGQYGI